LLTVMERAEELINTKKKRYVSPLDKILENNNSKHNILFLSRWAQTTLRFKE
jgi:hypothetical protein